MPVEQRLRTSLKEIHDLKAALDEHAIVAITDPQGRITYVNEKFCAISKYSEEELIGQDHGIINSGYHSKAFIQDLWRTIGKGNVWKGEIQNKAKDGTVYWVDTTIVPFLDADDKPYQYVAIRTDITERKRVEGEIKDLNAKLEKRVLLRTTELQAANQELESFSYSVSHDLRAPLRHVQGYIDLLGKHGGKALDEKCRRYLTIASESVTEMGRLIDNLLEFSRMGRVEMREASVDLDKLVRDTADGLHRGIQGRNIVWRLGPLPRVKGDPALLKQVFINLISNAIKYTRPRDPAQIETGVANETNGEVVMFVRDNGVGFDMKYADKLFTVFQRLHRADEFEGTGVGLATARQIINRHGGRIWAESAVNLGATFYFTLARPTKDHR